MTNAVLHNILGISFQFISFSMKSVAGCGTGGVAGGGAGCGAGGGAGGGAGSGAGCGAGGGVGGGAGSFPGLICPIQLRYFLSYFTDTCSHNQRDIFFGHACWIIPLFVAASAYSFP